MNERQGNYVRLTLARLGLILALAAIALWAWPMAKAHADDPFATSYGGPGDDHGYDIQQTADGGYVMAGVTESSGVGSYDAWVLKLNTDGSVAWQKTYGGTDYDDVDIIQQTADGGYVVAGFTSSFGAGGFDVWVLKLDADGDVVWQKTYGGTEWDFAHAAQQTDDGGYVVAGWTESFGAGEHDVWVLKLAADGSIVWQKTYGGTAEDDAYAIQQAADGGYIVAGRTYSFGAGYEDVWVLKLDADGDIAWQKTYGGAIWDEAWAIQQTADGGYVVAGYTRSFGAGSWDAWVLKLDADGNIAWQKTYGEEGEDFTDVIQQTDDGGYVVAASTRSFGAGNHDAWVLKLDADGSITWQKTYGGTGDDHAWTMQQTADDGYVVTGSTTSFGSGGDAWVLKLSAIGTFCTECGLGEDSMTTPVDSSATPVDSAATPADSPATPADSSATVTDTNVIPEPICVCAPEPVLTIAKTAMPTNDVPYHSAVTYTVMLGNVGTLSDTNVLLTDTLPIEVDFGRWVPGGQPPGAEVVADELTWQGTVTAGQAITFTFVVSHVGDYDDVVVNTARFSGTLQAGEDSATFAIVGQGPVLFIAKAATPTNDVPYHGAVTYTVMLGNSSSGSDTNVLLTDTLPIEVDFARWVEQPAGAEVVADELTWQGAVTAGESISFTFVVSHVGAYGDVVANTAHFSGTSQAGEDDVTFTITSQAMYTVYLPLVLRNH